MKKQQLTTTQNTNLILGKTKSLMTITNKLLEGKNKELTTHKDITIIGNLMWEKETQEEMIWHNAIEYARNLRLGSYDDWRLPSIEELREVVTLCGGINTTYDDDNCDEITDKNIANEIYQANHKVKGFASKLYWSSTTYANGSYDAWFVSFSDGYHADYCKDDGLYVRCVRDRQISLSQKDNKETSIHQKIFSQFVKKLHDRDEKLGRCFERNVTFESFENNKLLWSSEAKGEDKKMLITHWGLINMFVKDTFGFETKIVNRTLIIGNLMWEKESREVEWDGEVRIEYAKNLRVGGYDDWRLPTMEELHEVVARCGGIPAEYDNGCFEKNEIENEANEIYQLNYKEKGFLSGFYLAEYSSYRMACDIDFTNGSNTCYAGGRYYIRCVRTI